MTIIKYTMTKTILRIQETGAVKNRVRTGHPKTATTSENSINVMQGVVENPESL